MAEPLWPPPPDVRHANPRHSTLHSIRTMNPIAPRFLDALRADPKAFDTPCFVYDPQRARANYTDLRALLGTRLIVSVKANHNMDVNLRTIQPGMDGFELGSAGELTMMPKTAGAPVFLNNPAMDAGFMRSGLAMGATFIIDRPSQLPALLAAAGTRTPLPLILRVNGSVLQALVKDAPPPERVDHFGMDLDSLMAAVDFIRDKSSRVKMARVSSTSRMCNEITSQVSRKAPLLGATA